MSTPAERAAAATAYTAGLAAFTAGLAAAYDAYIAGFDDAAIRAAEADAMSTHADHDDQSIEETRP